MFKVKFTSQADSHACRALEKDIEVAFKKNLKDKSKKNAKSENRILFLNSFLRVVAKTIY